MKFVFILALCLIHTQCQSGGGGGGGGGGRGGSGGSSGYYYNYDSGGDSSCTDSCWIPITAVFSTVVVIIALYFCYKNGYLKCDYFKIKKEKEGLLKSFIQHNNTSKKDELIYALQNLQNSYWIMQYYQKGWNRVRILNKKFEINYHQEINKYSIDINLKAHDNYGESTYIGHIIQNDNQWNIFMIKNYDDKTRSQQQGEYAILIFEGSTNQIPEGFKGKWYFYHASHSNGDWRWEGQEEGL